MYRIGIILYLSIGLVFARTFSNASFRLDTILDNSIDGNHENEIESEDYESVCELSTTPPAPGSKCCGIDVTSSPRIVGGEPTLMYQYPWLALIEYLFPNGDMGVGCGGSLISSSYVLTAAHCVNGAGIPWYVRLGVYNRSQTDCVQGPSGEQVCPEGTAKIRIEKILPHENFVEKDNSGHLLNHNDIALLKLKYTAPYTVTIRPICLPTSDLNEAGGSLQNHLRLTAAGWGITEQYWQSTIVGGRSAPVLVNGPMSDVKRHVQLPYVPLETCARFWNVNPFVVCAGGEIGKDTCRGDSGGPLMFSKDGRFELTGINSYSATQCGMGFPGVFTNVYKYLAWIQHHMME